MHYPSPTEWVGDNPDSGVFGVGERRAVFLGPLTTTDKLPKDATAGRILVGKLQLGKLSEVKDSRDAPSSVPFTFL